MYKRYAVQFSFEVIVYAMDEKDAERKAKEDLESLPPQVDCDGAMEVDEDYE